MTSKLFVFCETDHTCTRPLRQVTVQNRILAPVVTSGGRTFEMSSLSNQPNQSLHDYKVQYKVLINVT